MDRFDATANRRHARHGHPPQAPIGIVLVGRGIVESDGPADPRRVFSDCPQLSDAPDTSVTLQQQLLIICAK
jgi:hypothetical protein